MTAAPYATPVVNLGTGPDDDAAVDLYHAFLAVNAALAGALTAFDLKADLATLTAAQLTDVSEAVKIALAASSLPDVRSALGLAIGSNVQAWGADLDAIKAQGTAPFGRSLLAGADPVSVRGLLALGSAATLPAGLPGGTATLDPATGKLAAGQIPDALLGAVRYQTGWNAATNTPALPVPVAANKGFYYIVTTAGATPQPGPAGAITDWQVGDWVVSDGTYWEKVDSSDQVVSVAGLQGVISAAALKTALAVASGDIADATSLGRTLLTSASAAAVLAAIGAAAKGANSDITSLGGLTTPLSAGQGGTGYTSLSAALDALFGSTAGNLLVRGTSGWSGLAAAAAGLVLTANGAGALPSYQALPAGSALTFSPVRQTVQAGPAVSGAPSFLPASTSGTLALAFQNVAPGSPLVLSCAKGFAATGAVDAIAAFTANPSLTLPASATAFLYYDFDAASWGSTALAPIYQAGGTIGTALGQFTFDTLAMVGWLGNGSAAVRANRVFVGEAVTSATAVTSTVAYAYQGQFDGGWTQGLPSSGGFGLTKQTNLGVQAGDRRFVIECTTADFNYSVGDQIDDKGLWTYNGTYGAPLTVTTSRNNVSVLGYATTGGAPYALNANNKNGSGGVNLTQTAWRYKFVVRRGW